MEAIRTSGTRFIDLYFPLLDAVNNDGRFLASSSSLQTANCIVTYKQTNNAFATLTPSNSGLCPGGSPYAYFITVDRNAFVDIDKRYPIIVTVVDPAPKQHLDTAFLFYMPDNLVVDLIFSDKVEQKGSDKAIYFGAITRDINRIEVLPDNNELVIKATGLISNNSYNANFYNDKELTIPASDSVSFSGYKIIDTHANGSINLFTYFKVPQVPPGTLISEDILIEIKWKSYGAEAIQRYIFNVNEGVSLSSIGQAEVDTVITNNTKVDETHDWTGLALPRQVPGTLGGLITSVTPINQIRGIAGTKTTLDELNDISVQDFLTAIVDGQTVEYTLKLIKASVNGNYEINKPNTGDVTFYEEDGTTVLTVININAAGRSKVQ